MDGTEEPICSKCGKPPGKKKSQKTMVLRDGKYYHPQCAPRGKIDSTPTGYYTSYTFLKSGDRRGSKKR